MFFWKPLLNSVVRGERARHTFEVMIKRWSAAIIIQKNVKQWLTSNVYNDLQKDIIILQGGKIFRVLNYLLEHSLSICWCFPLIILNYLQLFVVGWRGNILLF